MTKVTQINSHTYRRVLSPEVHNTSGCAQCGNYRLNPRSANRKTLFQYGIESKTYNLFAWDTFYFCSYQCYQIFHEVN